jgi:hypothetical protein
VFYHGRSKWKRTETVKNVPEELKRFIPLFDYVLFDTGDIEDHAIIRRFKRPNVKIGVWFLKQSNNIMGFIRENPRLARELLREIRNIEKTNIESLVLYLYNVSGMEPDQINQIMKTASPESKDFLEKYRIKMIEQAREKGIEQGIEQGLRKTALNMISKGYSDEQIAEITNLSIKRIQALREEPSL